MLPLPPATSPPQPQQSRELRILALASPPACLKAPGIGRRRGRHLLAHPPRQRGPTTDNPMTTTMTEDTIETVPMPIGPFFRFPDEAAWTEAATEAGFFSEPDEDGNTTLGLHQ
jgi:hypothetical protein